MTEPICLKDIMRRLPHRYPFLLIDRVIEHESEKRIVAIKNVTINEPFFSGHFPDYPVMPGVLVLEAMAQACGLLASLNANEPENTILLFAGVDRARFKRQVVPGDQLVIEADVKKRRRGIWTFSATASVDARRACVADLMCAEQTV